MPYDVRLPFGKVRCDDGTRCQDRIADAWRLRIPVGKVAGTPRAVVSASSKPKIRVGDRISRHALASGSRVTKTGGALGISKPGASARRLISPMVTTLIFKADKPLVYGR